MKKKLFAVVLSMTCMMSLMAGCGSENTGTQNSYTVGISQFAEHGSLDN